MLMLVTVLASTSSVSITRGSDKFRPYTTISETPAGFHPIKNWARDVYTVACGMGWADEVRKRHRQVEHADPERDGDTDRRRGGVSASPRSDSNSATPTSPALRRGTTGTASRSRG